MSQVNSQSIKDSCIDFSMVGNFNQKIYQFLIVWNVKNSDLVLVLCAAS